MILTKFLDLLEQSVVLQAALTLMIWGTLSTLYLMGRQPPPELQQAAALILGFYFGAKFQYLVKKAG